MPPEIHKVVRQLVDRPADTHKYNYGHVLVIGGSPGFIGAPLLAATAALRVGAGLVTIASLPDVVDKLERRVKDIMTFRLPTNNQGKAVRDFITSRHVSVIIIGPGLGEDLQPLARELVATINLPAVIDAGGIAAFANKSSLLRQADHGLILTPHTGEFERLLNQQLPTDKAAQLEKAITFAKDQHVHLVLKGPGTLVAHPDGTNYHNTTGNPGLATAGTGDVLSGVIGGILAQGIAIDTATEAGVYIHGLAGDLAAKELTMAGMIASDLEHFIPRALKEIAGNIS